MSTDQSRQLNEYLKLGALALATGELQGRDLSQFVVITDSLAYGHRDAGGLRGFVDEALVKRIETIHHMAEAVATLEGNLPSSGLDTMPDYYLPYKTHLAQHRYASRQLAHAWKTILDEPAIFEEAPAILNNMPCRLDSARPKFAGVPFGRSFQSRFHLDFANQQYTIPGLFPEPKRFSAFTTLNAPWVKRPTGAVALTTALLSGPTIRRDIAVGLADNRMPVANVSTNTGVQQKGVVSVKEWAPSPDLTRGIRGEWISDGRLPETLEIETGPNAASHFPEGGMRVTLTGDVHAPKGPPGWSSVPKPATEHVDIVFDGGTDAYQVRFADDGPSQEKDITEVPLAPGTASGARSFRLLVTDFDGNVDSLGDGTITNGQLTSFETDLAALARIPKPRETALPLPQIPLLG